MSTALRHSHSAQSLLLTALADSSSARALTEDEWDVVVRVARSSRLLGTLGARLERSGATERIPRAVRAELRSESAVGRYRTRMVWWELDRLERALRPLGVQILLLKGAAYLIQGLSCAEGRSLADVDIMVPRERLHEIEDALLAYGWERNSLDPYDDRYYRRWSHELPPLRYGGGILELDVHHALLPPLGRIRPDTAALWSQSIATAHAPFRVLAPEDQILHAALHLFHDSDCANRLRDVADLDALLREFDRRSDFWNELIRHAAKHGAGRPLWFALRFARRLFMTPVPESAQKQMQAYAPHPMLERFMDILVESVLMPPDPNRGYSRGATAASWILMLRAMWLRFPPRLFVFHSLTKAMPWLRGGSARAQPM